MRIISVIVVLPLLYVMLVPQHSLAAELSAKETKINFELNESSLLDPIRAPYVFPGYQPVENSKMSRKMTINASAYTASVEECGKSDGITASGVRVREKQTIACPSQYAFGTKIKIDGYGTFTCQDRGGAIKGNKFDIYMKTKSQALAFGRRNLTAWVIE